MFILEDCVKRSKKIQVNQNMCIRNGALAIISRIKSWKKYFKSFRIHIFLLIVLSSLIPILTIKEVMLYSDRKSTRLNSSHVSISYAVFCLKKKRIQNTKLASS